MNATSCTAPDLWYKAQYKTLGLAASRICSPARLPVEAAGVPPTPRLR